MTTYIIKGRYPSYMVTDGDGLYVDTASDFSTVIKSFIHRLEPGDTIHWANACLTSSWSILILFNSPIQE